MVNDHIMEEIRQLQERVSNKYRRDLERMMDRLKAREAEDRSRIVSDVSDVQVPHDAVDK
jgi:polyhydroxyalkanoate synthesis regulator phasin